MPCGAVRSYPGSVTPPGRAGELGLRNSGVGGVVGGEQPLLLVASGELEEDERGAEQDGDDAGEVRPLVALQERGLRGRR